MFLFFLKDQKDDNGIRLTFSLSTKRIYIVVFHFVTCYNRRLAGGIFTR